MKRRLSPLRDATRLSAYTSARNPGGRVIPPLSASGAGRVAGAGSAAWPGARVTRARAASRGRVLMDAGKLVGKRGDVKRQLGYIVRQRLASRGRENPRA